MKILSHENVRDTPEHRERRRIETFDQTAGCDVHFDGESVSLALQATISPDKPRSLQIHIHCRLFAEVLQQFAKTASSTETPYGKELRNAAKALYLSLAANGDDRSDLTAEEEVLLLHVLE